MGMNTAMLVAALGTALVSMEQHNWLVEFLRGSAGWWIFSAFIQALPAPVTLSNPLYVAFYKFVNALGANFTQVRNSGK